MPIFVFSSIKPISLQNINLVQILDVLQVSELVVHISRAAIASTRRNTYYFLAIFAETALISHGALH